MEEKLKCIMRNFNLDHLINKFQGEFSRNFSKMLVVDLLYIALDGYLIIGRYS